MSKIEVFSTCRMGVLAAAAFALAPYALGAVNGSAASATDGHSAAGCAEASVPVVVSADVMRNQLTALQQTANPPSKAAINGAGVVVLSVVIDCAGKVIGSTVVSGATVMAKAAKDAVNTWTYKPYLVNGEPVMVKTSVTMTFGPGKLGTSK